MKLFGKQSWMVVTEWGVQVGGAGLWVRHLLLAGCAGGHLISLLFFITSDLITGKLSLSTIIQSSFVFASFMVYVCIMCVEVCISQRNTCLICGREEQLH